MEARQSPVILTRHDLEVFNAFWQSLPEADRPVLAEALDSGRRTIPATDPAGYPLPYLAYLLTLLIAERKQNHRLRRQLQVLRAALAGKKIPGE